VSVTDRACAPAGHVCQSEAADEARPASVWLVLQEHIWSDEPITSPGEDVLQRLRFATVIASRITAINLGQDSTVFGVVGPWGAGKTSILNMVRGQLDDSWRVSDFSPWSAPDPQGLAMEFLAAVTAAVGSKRRQSREVRAAVKKYAKLGTPFLAMVPVVGGFASGVADRGLDLLDQGASWRREFDALAKVTKDLDYSILLVADDIDRLDSVELMTFLKVVRLLGRLPNVHYLIAYDQGTIEQLLASQGIEGRHGSFMEKIVQYPFELPRLSRAVVRRRLADTFETVLGPAAAQATATSARASELIAHLTPAMLTPRSVTRYCEQLLAYASAVSFDEIDAIDFAAVTYLRVAHHDLFDQLPNWEEELRSGKRASLLSSSAQAIDENGWRNRLAEIVPQPEVSTVLGILSMMFSGVPLLGVPRWQFHDRSINSERYFERYFLLRVSESDVSDALVDEILKQFESSSTSGGAASELSSILDDPADERAASALEKLIERRAGSERALPELTSYLIARLRLPLVEDSYASSGTILWRLAEKELGRSLAAGELDAESLLDAIGLENTMRFLFSIHRDYGVRRETKNQILGKFASAMRQFLHEDIEGSIRQGRIRALVSYFKQIEGEKSVAGLAAPFLTAYPERGIDLARGFVQVERWVGTNGASPELAFDEGGYLLVTTSESRIRAADHLPVVPDLSDIDPEDIEDNNQQLFAAAWATRVAMRDRQPASESHSDSDPNQ